MQKMSVVNYASKCNARLCVQCIYIIHTYTYMHTSRPRGGRQHEQLAARGIIVSKQSFVQRSLHSHFTTLPNFNFMCFQRVNQTPSIGLRHPSFSEEGAGKRCSECEGESVFLVLLDSWFFLILYYTTLLCYAVTG